MKHVKVKRPKKMTRRAEDVDTTRPNRRWKEEAFNHAKGEGRSIKQESDTRGGQGEDCGRTCKKGRSSKNGGRSMEQEEGFLARSYSTAGRWEQSSRVIVESFLSLNREYK